MIEFKPWKARYDLVRETLEMIRADYRFIHAVDDTSLIDSVLCAYFANYLPGPPVWLLLVGPSASGKTVTLSFLSKLPHVFEASTITEAGLLSGTAEKEKDKAPTGGLLVQMGSFGIMLIKDFTSLLSMCKEKMLQVMAAFREIADGLWTRRVGSGGGSTKVWRGKAGFIGCVTEVIDQKQEARQQMGERFLMWRADSSCENSQRIASRALSDGVQEALRRDEIAMLVSHLYEYMDPPSELPELPEALQRKLGAAALIASRSRSTVHRNGYNHEILSLESPEEPARIAKQLRLAYFGFLMIGCTDAEAWSGVQRFALDSMPAIRKRLLMRLYRAEGCLITSELALETKGINNLAKRALEELTLFDLVDRTDMNSQMATWGLTSFAKEQLDTMFSPLSTDATEAEPRLIDEESGRTESDNSPVLNFSPDEESKSRSDCSHVRRSNDEADSRAPGTRRAG